MLPLAHPPVPTPKFTGHVPHLLMCYALDLDPELCYPPYSNLDPKMYYAPNPNLEICHASDP
jgi:hypothetical protein